MKKFITILRVTLFIILFVGGCLALGVLMYEYAEVVILLVGIVPMVAVFFGEALNNGGKMD